MIKHGAREAARQPAGQGRGRRHRCQPAGKELTALALTNICYSLAMPDCGVTIADLYQASKGKGLVPTPNAGGLSVRKPTAMGEPKLEATYARGWYKNICADIWG
jgi:sulfide dehydrogenase [flavocytochrome c] flavoprotein subunit